MLNLLFVLLAFAGAPQVATPQPLNCAFGSSERWGSGWCDLQPPLTLGTGVCLKLVVGGTAKQVVARALCRGDDPNQAGGLLGGIMQVPPDRQLIVKLNRTFPNIVQISVHGGSAAWQFRFSAQNGPADLQLVEQLVCPIK